MKLSYLSLIWLGALLLLNPRARAQDLDFLSAGYPPGATSHSYSGVGNPPVSIIIGISGPGVFSNSSPSATGPGLTTTSVNFASNAEQKIYTFTFSAPVLGLQFDLRAINQNLGFTNPARNYQDQVTVTAINGQGQPVAVYFSANPAEITVTGNTITANSATASIAGVSFGDGVKVLTISFGNGPAAGSNPDANGFTISDMSWSALPVRLALFRASVQQEMVQLYWETDWERGADRFVIESSANATEFVSIGEQKATGATGQRQSYAFADPEPLLDTRYYRLKQINTDGSFDHSKIIAAVSDSEQPRLEVLSSPASGDRIYLRLRNVPSGNLTLSTLTGQVISTRIESAAADDRVLLPAQPLPSGIYLLRAQAGRHSLVRKVVVQ